MFHPKSISQGFRTTVHIGNIRQTAFITDISPLKVNHFKHKERTIYSPVFKKRIVNRRNMWLRIILLISTEEVMPNGER